MRRLAALLAVLALALATVVATVASAQPSSASVTTPAQLTKRFKLATGQKLILNKQRSNPGHYLVYDLGVQTAAKKARWGTFTVHLVTNPDVEAEVTSLLADSRTGMPGTPSAGNIYWYLGVTLHGEKYWQAKKRYGQNVVLHWIGANPVKKTDASWKRLHVALTQATK
jgi:hypothetical protein